MNGLLRSMMMGTVWLSLTVLPVMAQQDQASTDPVPLLPSSSAYAGRSSVATGAKALEQGVGIRVLTPSAAPKLDDSGVDIGALRFFAQRGDTDSFNKELANIRRLRPGWNPPSDLLANATQPPVDDGPVWRLYEKKDYAGARAMVAELTRANPSWKPSRELTRALETGEARLRMTGAIEAKDWMAVRAVAAANPSLMSCDSIDLAWAGAEALVRTGAVPQATQFYRTIISTCKNADNRLATIQKATDLIDRSAVLDLIALERTRPRNAEQEQRLTAWLNDFDRGTVLANLGEGKQTAANPQEIDQIAHDAVTRQDPETALLIGWWHYRNKRYAESTNWFQQAMTWRPDEKAAEGLALSYIGAKRRADADRVIKEWKDRSPAIAKLAKDMAPRGGKGGAGAGPVADPAITKAVDAQKQERYADCLMLTASADRKGADPALALTRGWCLYELHRPTEATSWFETSIDRAGSNTKVRNDAAFGRALSLMRSGEYDEALDMMQEYKFDQSRLDAITVEMLGQDAARTYAAGDYAQTLRYIAMHRDVAPVPRHLEVIEGWAQYQLHMYPQAYKTFAELNAVMPSPESEEGLRVLRHKMEAGN